MRTKLQLINQDDDSFVNDEDYSYEMERKQADMEKNKELIEPQFLYLGRWVNKKHFRAFVYNNQGQKLANSYEEYEKLVSTGLWFSSKEELLTTVKKPSRPVRKSKPIPEDLPDEPEGEVIEYGTDR